MAIVSRRPIGVTSSGAGTLEFMVHRSLTSDDEKGLSAAVVDRNPAWSHFAVCLVADSGAVPFDAFETWERISSPPMCADTGGAAARKIADADTAGTTAAAAPPAKSVPLPRGWHLLSLRLDSTEQEAAASDPPAPSSRIVAVVMIEPGAAAERTGDGNNDNDKTIWTKALASVGRTPRNVRRTLLTRDTAAEPAPRPIIVARQAGAGDEAMRLVTYRFELD
jgi:hypothetical protein